MISKSGKEKNIFKEIEMSKTEIFIELWKGEEALWNVCTNTGNRKRRQLFAFETN